jgi:hypothetical protein
MKQPRGAAARAIPIPAMTARVKKSSNMKVKHGGLLIAA